MPKNGYRLNPNKEAAVGDYSRKIAFPSRHWGHGTSGGGLGKTEIWLLQKITGNGQDYVIEIKGFWNSIPTRHISPSCPSTACEMSPTTIKVKYPNITTRPPPWVELDSPLHPWALRRVPAAVTSSQASVLRKIHQNSHHAGSVFLSPAPRTSPGIRWYIVVIPFLRHLRVHWGL